MSHKKKVLAISGSTRKQSTNLDLIHAIIKLADTVFQIDVFENISEIPHFNPDMDTDHPPIEVQNFRQKIREADGILICTPEYAMGVPGTLKNAIDWTVSSCEFSHKPVALITASSVGEKSHASLLGTLRIIESNISDATQLLIPFAKTKINKKPCITDERTSEEVKTLIGAFYELMLNDSTFT